MRQFGEAWFADAAVHTTGLLAGLIACLALVFIAIRRARSATVPSVKSRMLLALGLYGLGLICMLTCSALYNLYVDHPLRGLLRRFDHAAIFVMIAGTITPFALLCTRGPRGVRMVAAIWALAAAGIALKLTIPAQFELLSIPAYLLLGWTIALLYKPIKANMPWPGLPLLAAGCLLYTAGVRSTFGTASPISSQSGTASCSWAQPCTSPASSVTPPAPRSSAAPVTRTRAPATVGAHLPYYAAPAGGAS